MDIIAMVKDPDEVDRVSGIDGYGEDLSHIYVDDQGNKYFSVTTIINNFENDEKDKHLEKWKEENDGSGETEHHEDILKYSQLRGTLVHAEAQEKYCEEKVWGEEEDVAYEKLEMFGKYYGEDVMKKYKKDKKYFVENVHDLLDDKIEKIYNVEDYIFYRDDNIKYAGQVDLVYENKKGELIVCDLKTSKYTSYEYYLQGNAYARAIENVYDKEIDKIQICRVNPDENTKELKTINRKGAFIKPKDIKDTKYGNKIVLSSPFKAKEDIKSLDWNLYHQEWDSELEKWLIAVKNNNGTVASDLFFKRMIDKGWSVNINRDIAQKIKNNISEDNSFNYKKVNEESYNIKTQLFKDFKECAKKIEDRRPITTIDEFLEDFPVLYELYIENKEMYKEESVLKVFKELNNMRK